MGNVSKKIVAKQKADAEKTVKLINDLIWYVNSMNECIAKLVASANELNAITQECVREYKEG